VLSAGAVGSSVEADARPSGAALGKPDLVPLLPTSVSSVQVAPVFVDAYQEPGKLLYRFDAVLENEGGTLDLFRDEQTGDAMQAIWAGGIPDRRPDPNVAPSGPNVALEDRGPHGGLFVYSALPGHRHWHFAAAARYELLVPGRAPRVGAKIGFCLTDTWGTSTWFPLGYLGRGPAAFCAPGAPAASFVRMGISPGAGDDYWSQLAAQWIDVTALAPGRYVLRATANPLGAIDESDTANDVLDEPRTIPGTIAGAATVRVRGATRIRLSGRIVAPRIPARTRAGCPPSPLSASCYIRASASGPLAFAIARFPRHGALSIEVAAGLHAAALYVPDRGYVGRDSFTFTVVDRRGLRSLPAVVRLTVAGPTGRRG
jgi:hypothetical protein